ncbi:uncharacterized protein LOC132726056 [Ruditapes philippinarum]|uniref:uncharacterized protein LOC132726056 n=1 Tax=Ruditapes philippinarum TaxID=129788 RepID=UPI00295B4025|nr:uncharacterized protein LOC132726056 [Ruditapes philippinarum]
MAKAAGRSKKKNVQFNLAISDEQAPFNPNEDQVFLVFKDNEEKKFALHPLLSDHEGIYKLSCTLEVPYDKITNDKYLAYNYELGRKDGTFEKEERAKGCLTRTLTIPKKNKDDNWCQHDGFFEHKSKMFTTLKNWWNDPVFQHIETYMWLFFPDLKYKEKNGVSNFLSQLIMLINGLKKVYFTEGRYWKEEEECKRFVSKQCVDIISNIPEEKRDIEYTTVISFSMLLALFHTTFDVFNDTERERLSDYLKTTADLESQVCPEFEVFNQYFNKEKLGIFKGAIIKLARGTLQSTQYRSYLTLMPWIHFLSGECKPFEKIPFDMSHDHSEPNWWGVTPVKDFLDASKNKKWDMSHFEDKEKMSALFKMDFLLPRSILAATGLKDLMGMIQTRLFPVEVCLANIIFHTKNYEPHTFWDKKKDDLLQECMNCLLQNIDKICSKSVCLEVETELSYKMAIQLVMECLKTYSYEEKAMLSSVQIFLTCVVQFEKCTSDRTLSESKRHKVADDVKKICSKVIDWMKRLSSRSQSDKENYLKVWKSLHEQDTESDILQASWNKELSVQLAKTFGTYVCMNFRILFSSIKIIKYRLK